MGQYLKNKRSSAVVNNAPKLPTSSQIDYGEIAINFAKGYETISIKNNNGEIVAFSSDSALDKKYIESGAVVSALEGISTDGFFDDAEYDSSTKRINFKNNGTVKDYIDATDFIKDGMVSSVTVSGGNLVISFNTEAGREDIELALTQIFNPNNYYDKTAADGRFLTGYTETDPTVPAWAKAANKPTYTAAEVGALPTGTTLDNIADGSTRKLSDYSLTSHTHTAAEVGALPDTTDIPTEVKISGSGFTKNAITGITFNNTAVPVSNGVAAITATTGGGSTLPTVTSSDNGKVLAVVDGQWSAVTPVIVYSGNVAPDNLLGNNGDIYLQTS